MGGGGERVLWAIIARMLTLEKHSNIYISTNTKKSVSEVVADVSNRFGITVEHSERIHFVPFYALSLIQPQTYPVFTLLGQAIGMVIAALINLVFYRSATIIDTMGLPFMYPVFKYIGGRSVHAYTHYPFISHDMVRAVKQGHASYNNKNAAGVSWKTNLKVLYYRALALLYSLAGKSLTYNAANSTWTANHIALLWGVSPRIIYPPANVCELVADAPPHPRGSGCRVVSLSQFRPEKDHRAQLAAWELVVKSGRMPKGAKLSICGATRGRADEEILEGLKKEARERGIADSVEFNANLKWSQVKEELFAATAALHTMQNEHFGISLVEFLAAGLVVVAHKSGGPRLDIIGKGMNEGVEPAGFLCSNSQEFADSLLEIMENKNGLVDRKLKLAEKALRRFPDDELFGLECAKYFLG